MTPPKSKQRSTINEVAERAGVAKTTVSHALSGKRPVAPETRERIFAAMRELQYSPSPIARRLAGSPGHTIALILPLASPSISDVEVRFIAAIGEVVNRRGYTFLTLTSPQVDVDELRRIVYSGLVDGVVLMRIQIRDERVKLLKDSDIPFVMIGRTRDNKDLTYVDLNGEAAIGLAVEYLLRLGHRSIGFICPDDLNFAFAYRIMKGYEKSCRQYELEPVTVAAEMAADAGYRATVILLEEHPETTAVIVWSDVVAVGVVSALRDKGYRIPEEISVISFDRSEHLHLASFDLTVIDTRPEVIGAQAANMLLDMLKNEPLAATQILLPPLLISGRSTAKRVATAVPA